MVQLVISLAEPDQHRRIEPVLRFRPVDADQQHAAAPLHQDIFRLRRAGQSGRRRFRLRKRIAGNDKARGKCGGPGPAIMKSRRAMPAGVAQWASAINCLLENEGQ